MIQTHCYLNSTVRTGIRSITSDSNSIFSDSSKENGDAGGDQDDIWHYYYRGDRGRTDGHSSLVNSCDI